MRTDDVKRLVSEVLADVPLPYTSDVIEDVFLGIEQRPDWQKRYNALSADLGKTVVNNWCSFWTANLAQRSGSVQVPATRTRLVANYSKLTEATVPPRKAIKEVDAVAKMAAYFEEHRAALPPAVRRHRETLVSLLIGGASAEDAFAAVISNGV